MFVIIILQYIESYHSVQTDSRSPSPHRRNWGAAAISPGARSLPPTCTISDCTVTACSLVGCTLPACSLPSCTITQIGHPHQTIAGGGMGFEEEEERVRGGRDGEEEMEKADFQDSQPPAWTAVVQQPTQVWSREVMTSFRFSIVRNEVIEQS